MSSFSSALARTSESASVRSAPSVPSGIRSIDETRRRGHPSQRARSIAQCLYLICPDDDSTRATSKKNLGAEKRVYSSIHVLSWAPKLHPVPSACARALVLTPDSYRGGGCDVSSQAPFSQDCGMLCFPDTGTGSSISSAVYWAVRQR